jgi:hypothetical protein
MDIFHLLLKGDLMFQKYSLNHMIAMFVAAGFFFLIADSILEHLEILGQELLVYIPIAFSVLGFLISTIAAVLWKERVIRFLRMTLFVAFLISAAGLYFHIKEEDDEEITAEQFTHEQKEKDKPILAPLSFAGLAVIGLLGTSRKWKTE